MGYGQNARTEVAVVGGGAVGLCTALYLARVGRHVTVLDRGGAGGASSGNAGMIVPSHVVPLAAPGVVEQGLRWLMKAEAPFYIKPRLDLELARWLWRFRAACTEDHVRRSVPVLRDLSLASAGLFDELAEIDGMEDLGYARTGLLMLHRTEKGRGEALSMADQAEAAGLEVERLGREEVLALDPHIHAPFEGGVLYRQDGRIDPEGLLRGLVRLLEREGVVIRRGEAVEGFDHAGGTVTRVRTSKGTLAAEEFVLAAGAWSGRLARALGIRLPVQPAKGYSITLAATDEAPRIPHILTEDRLTVTPMPGRVRFAGTLALAGFDGTLSPRHTASLLRLVQAYGSAGGGARPEPEIWYGYRPCSPDGLPFIGRPRSFKNVTVATGHGMMGITLAPITGKLVSEIIQGAPPSCDLAPCAVER